MVKRTLLWTNPKTGQTGWKWEIGVGTVVIDSWPYGSQAEAEQAMAEELKAQNETLRELLEQ